VDLLELIPQKSIPRDDEAGPQHAFPLCSWVYHMKFTIVETILFMGFELELYQPYEYIIIYRFLYLYED
jgi:N-alpha-acetyltransferase 35, NatC auxiliary subunit